MIADSIGAEVSTSCDELVLLKEWCPESALSKRKVMLILGLRELSAVIECSKMFWEFLLIKEMKRMEELGVIVKCEEPTEWVSALAIVEPKKLRVCVDPKQLKKYVMRQHTCLPTPEETSAKIEGSQVFSHFDLKHGYWQLPLTHEVSMKTAFLTPIGRYRFLRMPFGLKSANEIFQEKMCKVFEGIEGIIVMFEDILVHAKSAEEHDQILDKCLARCQEMGVKLNPDKCKLNVDEVRYIGNIIITEMLPPCDKKSAQRFLGMVTYLGKYIPNLSEVTAPIRQLLHKNNAFSGTMSNKPHLRD